MPAEKIETLIKIPSVMAHHSGSPPPHIAIACEVCKAESVLMHCSSCHLKLCSDCVGKHLSSQNCKQHDIEGFKYRKNDVKLPVCPQHPSHNCSMYCDDCDEAVCSKCVAASDHKRHRLDDIIRMYVARRLLLLQEASFLENTVIPQYDKMESILDTKMSKLSNDYSSVLNKLVSEEEALHEMIRSIFHQKKQETLAMREKDLKTLHEQKNGISYSKLTVEGLVSKYKHVCGSNDVDKILRCPFEKDQYRRIPPVAEITPPTFSSVELEEEFFKQFVKLSPSVQILKSRGQRLESTQSNGEKKELAAEVELVASFKGAYEELQRVKCIGDFQAWLSGSAHGTLTRMNINGEVLETVRVTHGYAPKDMAVTTDGHLIYCDVGNLSIMAIKDGTSKVIAKSNKWLPTAVCVTSATGHLLVCMISKDQRFGRVVRYVGSKAKHKIQFDDKDQDLFKKPTSVAENVNENICVIDSSSQSLVVLNKGGLFRFKYNGSQKTHLHTFYPSGLATDNLGQIVVGDRMNTCLDIIDKDGQFIRSIAGSILNIPSAISVDDEENLWVGEFHTGIVKIIKYLQPCENNGN